jgi:membrane-associated phospholipid phosphatase
MGRAIGATGFALPVLLVPPMALSRILLGVHYPSDVAVGVALGAAIAGIAGRLKSRLFANGPPSARGVAE